MLGFFTLVAVGHAAECSSRPPAAALEARLVAAEIAYADHDRDAVLAAEALIREDVRCTPDVLAASIASRIHRVLGLVRWLEQRDADAKAAFSAARAVDPLVELPGALAPEGSALAAAWAASESTNDTTALPPAASLTLWVDGVQSARRPAMRPAVVQATIADGRVVYGAWVEADSPVTLPMQMVGAQQGPTLSNQKKGPNLPLGLAALGAAAVAGGLYAGAWSTHDAYYALPAGDPGRAGLKDANHGLTIGAGAAAGLSVVGGVLAVVTGRW